MLTFWYKTLWNVIYKLFLVFINSLLIKLKLFLVFVKLLFFKLKHISCAYVSPMSHTFNASARLAFSKSSFLLKTVWQYNWRCIAFMINLAIKYLPKLNLMKQSRKKITFLEENLSFRVVILK